MARGVLFVIKKHTIKTEWAVVEYRSGPPYPGGPYAQGRWPCIFFCELRPELYTGHIINCRV
jgi:hypothetical protein